MNRPRLVLRIEFDAGRLGHGKVELLEQIRDGQSLAAAARAMGMSYKRAWDLLATLNEMFDQPVAVSRPGRTKAGSTALTDFGTTLIGLFRDIERQATHAARHELDTLAHARATRARGTRAAAPHEPSTGEPRADADPPPRSRTAVAPAARRATPAGLNLPSPRARARVPAPGRPATPTSPGTSNAAPARARAAARNRG